MPCSQPRACGLAFEFENCFTSPSRPLAQYFNPVRLIGGALEICVSTAEGLVERWRELGESILTKHNDGYVRQPEVKSEGVEYPEAWLRRILAEKPDQFKLPQWPEEATP